MSSEHTQTCSNDSHAASQSSSRNRPGAAATPGGKELSSEKRIHIDVPCKLACKTRTCNDGSTALSPSSFTESWWTQRTSARAVPSGGSGHSPPEEQPARRKRRNSLMVVERNPEINRADVCLAGTIKDNTCQSHNEPKCSGPAQAPQRHRSATRRCPG